MNYDGLKEVVITRLGNSPCPINTRKFQNDMTTFSAKDDILTLLVHLGYLTYDKKNRTVSIPNLEIAQEFLNAVDEPEWEGVMQSLRRSEALLKDTWALNNAAVAHGIAAVHNETSSILKYNNEHSLCCTLLMVYYSAKAYYINPIMEMPAEKDSPA